MIVSHLSYFLEVISYTRCEYDSTKEMNAISSFIIFLLFFVGKTM